MVVDDTTKLHSLEKSWNIFFCCFLLVCVFGPVELYVREEGGGSGLQHRKKHCRYLVTLTRMCSATCSCASVSFWWSTTWQGCFSHPKAPTKFSLSLYLSLWSRTYSKDAILSFQAAVTIALNEVPIEGAYQGWESQWKKCMLKENTLKIINTLYRYCH